MGDGNIGELGEDRMVLEKRKEIVKIIGKEIIIKKEERMGVENGGDGRGMKERRIRRVEMKLDFKSIGEGLGKRNVMKVEKRSENIEGNKKVVMLGRGKD